MLGRGWHAQRRDGVQEGSAGLRAAVGEEFRGAPEGLLQVVFMSLVVIYRAADAGVGRTAATEA